VFVYISGPLCIGVIYRSTFTGQQQCISNSSQAYFSYLSETETQPQIKTAMNHIRSIISTL